MATMRRLKATDLNKLAKCNLDPLTETYDFSFYAEYLRKWPECCQVLVSRQVLGKIENSPFDPPNPPYDPETNSNPNYLPWHAHVTVLTVAPSARRLGYASRLSRHLEEVGERNDCWFVDLYVRVENTAAITLYEKLGYLVYRRVIGYYNDEADAFDMRKPLSRDKNRKTVQEGKVYEVQPSEVW